MNKTDKNKKTSKPEPESKSKASTVNIKSADFDDEADAVDSDDDASVSATASATSSVSSLDLELGDIIQIISPNNEEYDNFSFIIDYIDDYKVKLINLENMQLILLSLDEEGNFVDESIEEIHLLSRSPEKGYARQHQLLPKTWVDIHFNGEIPYIITGQITNLDEDMIEITSIPKNDVYYIDFAYQGIPEEIPIEKIIIRDTPSKILAAQKGTQNDESSANIVVGEPIYEMTPTGESIIDIPENVEFEENIKEQLEELYLDINELFAENLDDIYQKVELTDAEKKYNIDIQLNDLTDELLAHKKMNNKKIHNVVERFKQLREMFSRFNKNGYVVDVKKYGSAYFPIIDHIINLDEKIPWILPVVSQRKKLYNLINDDENTNDIVVYNLEEQIQDEIELFEDYNKNKIIGNELKYTHLYSKLAEHYTPFNNGGDSAGAGAGAGAGNLDNLRYYLQIQHPTKVDVETLVNNDGEYNSTVSQEIITSKNSQRKLAANMSKFKYFIQKYNSAESSCKSGGGGGSGSGSAKQAFASNAIKYSKNENLNVKSLVFLPKSIVSYSNIYSKTANILKRTNLGKSVVEYSQLFNQSKELLEDIFINIDVGGAITIAPQPIFNFLKDIRNFYVEPKYYDDSTTSVTENDYRLFLHRIFENNGNIKSLLSIFKREAKLQLSLFKLLQLLEPFFIYTHNLIYTQYNVVKKILHKNIKKCINRLHNTREDIVAWRKMTTSRFFPHNTIYGIFDGVSQGSRAAYLILREFYINDAFINKEEGTLVPEYSSTEVLLCFLQNDYAELFFKLILQSMFSLLIPDKLVDSLIGETTATKDATYEEKDAIKFRECKTKLLAKQYLSADLLSRDNLSVAVYFDKDLDNAPYFVVKNNKTKQKQLDSIKFAEFIAETLMTHYEYNEKTAKETADIICRGEGKRPVKDGDYAVLELRPQEAKPSIFAKKNKKEEAETAIELRARTIYKYYKRIGNSWIIDNELSDQNLPLNEVTDIFCNIRKDPTKPEFKEETENKISKTIFEIQENLGKEIEKQKKYMLLKKHYLEKEEYRNNFIAIEIGKFAKEANVANMSPHVGLLDKILAQTDFVKRQGDICKFFYLFCREPILGVVGTADDYANETPHWYYCTETNTPLLPVSIYLLASTFVNNRDNFTAKLDEICAEYGQLSDDGDSIVDKYTGRIIRRIDFISEDGYDESGFRIVGNAVIEKDTEELAKEAFNGKIHKLQLKQDATIQMISNILFSLAQQIDLPIDDPAIDFIIRLTVMFLGDETIVMSEAAYLKQISKLDKDKQHTVPPFKIYKNQMMFFILGCVLLISIQTSIPSFKTRKTFPGCVQSFSGFPLEDGGESGGNGGAELTFGGLTYISCIMSKMKSSIYPWNSIEKLSSQILLNRMKKVVELILQNNYEIQDLLLKKRNYIAENPQVLVEEHDIKKWTSFLPPLLDYTIKDKQLRQTAAEFDDEFRALIKTGKKEQHNSILVLKSKNIIFSFAIISIINSIVKNKGVLLKTMMQVPFLENSCCSNPGGGTLINPITYFKKENKDIDIYLKYCNKNDSVLHNIRRLSMPLYLFNEQNTAYTFMKIPQEYNDINLYSCFIYYCNFDNELPIPADLLVVCSEKPKKRGGSGGAGGAGYSPLSTIYEKIEYLKKNGKQFNLSNLYTLMKIVNNRNRINMQNQNLGVAGATFNEINVLADVISHLELKNSEIVEESYRLLLLDILKKYNPKKLYETDDFLKSAISQENPFLSAVIRLRDYLSRINSKLHTQIMNFITSFGNLNLKELKKVEEFIGSIMDWNNTAGGNGVEENVSEDAWKNNENFLYIITNFIKNSIYKISRVYPNLITNNTLYQSVPQHWDLSAKHNADIKKLIVELMASLEKYKSDTVLSQVLLAFEKKVGDLNIFIQNIPVYSSIFSEGKTFYRLFDKTTLFLIYMNAWYSLMFSFVEIANDDEILRYDTIDKKHKQNIFDKDYDVADDVMGEFENIQVVSGYSADLKSSVCSLILDFIKLDKQNKQYINLNYGDISRKMNMTKKDEKATITGFLEKMEKDERSVENQLKKYKMGRWNLGMQKGIFMYDKQLYDETREENLGRMYKEFEDDADDVVVQPLNDEFEAEDLDALDAAAADAEIDAEYGIHEVADDDYDDGFEDERDTDY